MMRFRGGGVGHKSTRDATNFFKKDRDQLDTRSVTIGDGGGEVIAEEAELWLDEPQAEDANTEEEEEEEEEEEDFGYTMSQSDDEVDEVDEVEAVGDGDSDGDIYFGPEDDGGAVDPDMDELGYADL